VKPLAAATFLKRAMSEWGSCRSPHEKDELSEEISDMQQEATETRQSVSNVTGELTHARNTEKQPASRNHSTTEEIADRGRSPFTQRLKNDYRGIKRGKL